MDKKRKFSKKALRDFELIDAAIKFNDQNAYTELTSNYKNSIFYTNYRSRMTNARKKCNSYFVLV